MSTNYSHIALPDRGKVSDQDIALAEALNQARILSNALEHHAPQDRTYGAVEKALRTALAYAHAGSPLNITAEAYDRASAWADAVIAETIDNGESIAYSIDVVATWRTFHPGDTARIVETGRVVTVVAHDSLDVVVVKGFGQQGTFPEAVGDIVRVDRRTLDEEGAQSRSRHALPGVTVRP